MVQDWNPRKGDLFNEQHVSVAWERLEEEGWLRSGLLLTTRLLIVVDYQRR